MELSREPIRRSPASTIGKAMHILTQHGGFTNFLPISHARVPILKCQHIRTGYQCDINFSDSYGILNSPIVAKLLTFDSRIYVLATIIKYWAKIHDCSGKNRISNYAIMWMLLFYLQQLNEPIVPPMIEFQKRIHPYFVKYYNFAYDHQLSNKTKNQMRCSELLMGFFKFYKDFDFGTKVICPLFGKAYEKDDILSKKLPEFLRYEQILTMNPLLRPMQFNKVMCIQDPFEITHTIPGCIPKKDFQQIVAKIAYAAEIIGNELSVSGETTKLFVLIFDGDKFNEYAQKRQNQTKIPGSSPIYPRNFQNGSCLLHLEPTEHQLSIVHDILEKCTDTTCMEVDKQMIQQLWTKVVIEFFINTLREIFALKINSNTALRMDSVDETKTDADSTETNEANQKTSNEEAIETSSIEDTDKIVAKILDKTSNTTQFDIIGSQDVFLARKQIHRIDGNSFHVERMETLKRLKHSFKKPIQLKANVKIIVDFENYDSVSIEVTDRIKTKKNNFFKTFLTILIQNNKYLSKVYFLHKQGLLTNSNATDQSTKTVSNEANTNGQSTPKES